MGLVKSPLDQETFLINGQYQRMDWQDIVSIEFTGSVTGTGADLLKMTDGDDNEYTNVISNAGSSFDLFYRYDRKTGRVTAKETTKPVAGTRLVIMDTYLADELDFDLEAALPDTKNRFLGQREGRTEFDDSEVAWCVTFYKSGKVQMLFKRKDVTAELGFQPSIKGGEWRVDSDHITLQTRPQDPSTGRFLNQARKSEKYLVIAINDKVFEYQSL